MSKYDRAEPWWYTYRDYIFAAMFGIILAYTLFFGVIVPILVWNAEKSQESDIPDEVKSPESDPGGSTDRCDLLFKSMQENLDRQLEMFRLGQENTREYRTLEIEYERYDNEYEERCR